MSKKHFGRQLSERRSEQGDSSSSTKIAAAAAAQVKSITTTVPWRAHRSKPRRQPTPARHRHRPGQAEARRRAAWQAGRPEHLGAPGGGSILVVGVVLGDRDARRRRRQAAAEAEVGVCACALPARFVCRPLLLLLARLHCILPFGRCEVSCLRTARSAG